MGRDHTWFAMNTGVIEQPSASQQLRGNPSAAKIWLKAIELTSRIEADPCRLFADAVEDWHPQIK